MTISKNKVFNFENMRAVLTGDIIDSRNVENPQEWIDVLKKTLGQFGKSPVNWEIYRGDSFQLEINATEAFVAAFQIKAAIRTIAGLDVRISIGIGQIDFQANAVTLSNGSAFVNSGRAFDQLKDKKRSLILSSDNPDLTMDLNMMLQLAEGLLSHWTRASAEAISQILRNPGISQIELSKILGITQPSVSSRLRVAHADEILALIDYYSHRITRST